MFCLSMFQAQWRQGIEYIGKYNSTGRGTRIIGSAKTESSERRKKCHTLTQINENHFGHPSTYIY